jgi:glutamyl-tRNA reductase
MPVLTLGMNHKTASVDVRERVAFTDVRMLEALRSLGQVPAVAEAAIISTCNRMEIYAVQDEGGESQLLDWLRHWHRLPTQAIESHLYVHRAREAVQHLIRVACGLDSMVMGEPQILGQIKNAFRMANEAGTGAAAFQVVSERILGGQGCAQPDSSGLPCRLGGLGHGHAGQTHFLRPGRAKRLADRRR